MFGRIMAVVVAVIVLLTSVLSGLGLYTCLLYTSPRPRD